MAATILPTAATTTVDDPRSPAPQRSPLPDPDCPPPPARKKAKSDDDTPITSTDLDAVKADLDRAMAAQADPPRAPVKPSAPPRVISPDSAACRVLNMDDAAATVGEKRGSPDDKTTVSCTYDREAPRYTPSPTPPNIQREGPINNGAFIIIGGQPVAWYGARGGGGLIRRTQSMDGGLSRTQSMTDPDGDDEEEPEEEPLTKEAAAKGE